MALIKRLAGPEDRDPSTVANPDWPTIEAAIRRLNGEDCTLVSLNIGDPTPHMSIGGGGGRYIVYITADNQSFHTLIDVSAKPGKCQMKAGGQVGEYRQQICVGLADTLLAAKTFAESGTPDAMLTWETQ